nr:valine--trna ligase, mitochondrial 1 [Quercus suber]
MAQGSHGGRRTIVNGEYECDEIVRNMQLEACFQRKEKQFEALTEQLSALAIVNQPQNRSPTLRFVEEDEVDYNVGDEMENPFAGHRRRREKPLVSYNSNKWESGGRRVCERLLARRTQSQVLSEKNQEIEDEKKKKKKIEKAREKKLKKQKALEKAAKLQAQQTSTTRKRSEKKMVKRGGKEETSEDFLDPETPFGKKKRLSSQMAKQYSPTAVEKSWYAWWEKSGFFVADAKSCKPPFVIVLPPPNVTGALHIGHALTAAVELLIRLFAGGECLDTIPCGFLVVVEKKIMRERKLTRHDIGREKFVSEVWDWKNKYGGTILQQLCRLGASLDWSRECFTMDEKRSRAVTEAFVRLYKEKLVYRDERLVNWDYVLRTAISDIEVEHIEIKERTLLNVPGYEKPVEFGVLTSFAYPLEGELGEIVVATTRVETMLGDTAIAIHPDDPSLGQVLLRKINSNGGSEFAGMPRFKAREAVIESLQKKVLVLHYCVYKGLYRGAKGNEMRLGICSRTNDVVEPLSKPQWYVKCNSMARQALTNDVVEPLSKPQCYVKCNSMARQALDAIEDKKIEIIPKQYAADWKRWLENIRDWCVLRQLWWGHRVVCHSGG